MCAQLQGDISLIRGPSAVTKPEHKQANDGYASDHCDSTDRISDCNPANQSEQHEWGKEPGHSAAPPTPFDASSFERDTEERSKPFRVTN